MSVSIKIYGNIIVWNNRIFRYKLFAFDQNFVEFPNAPDYTMKRFHYVFFSFLFVVRPFRLRPTRFIVLNNILPLTQQLISNILQGSPHSQNTTKSAQWRKKNRKIHTWFAMPTKLWRKSMEHAENRLYRRETPYTAHDSGNYRVTKRKKYDRVSI